MKTTLDIELARQIFKPGEEIIGRVHLTSDRKQKFRDLVVSLQGEEVLGANSIARSIILPLVNEQQSFHPNGNCVDKAESAENPEVVSRSFPIRFTIPSNAPPSYASDTFQCAYYIKGRLDAVNAFDIIDRMRITIVPYTANDKSPENVQLLLEEENLKVKAELDRDIIQAGDTLTGSFYMEHIPHDAPSQVSFELKAQEISLEERFAFKRTLWHLVKEVPLKDVDTGYTMAKFEFPVPLDVPFSHKWASFEVDWSFCITVNTSDRRELRIEKPLLLRRMI